MPNTNFQTFHQMGSAISDFVKQATGRDSVQNIDMDHVTVAQNHVYEEVDISGQAVRFNAGAEGIPFEKCVVQIVPVQSGSGDPAPDNVRPITGWTMVNLYQSGQNLEDARVFRFPFPSEAGVVYGGTLDVVGGELVVLGVKDILTVVDGMLRSQFFYESTGQSVTVLGDNVRIAMNRISQTSNMNTVSSSYSTKMANLCSHYFAYNLDTAHWYINNQLYLYLPKVDVGETFESYKTFLQDNPFEVYIPFVTPITYHLTPQEITTLLGQNNIWADTGSIEVKFKDLKELY